MQNVECRMREGDFSFIQYLVLRKTWSQNGKREKMQQSCLLKSIRAGPKPSSYFSKCNQFRFKMTAYFFMKYHRERAECSRIAIIFVTVSGKQKGASFKAEESFPPSCTAARAS